MFSSRLTCLVVAAFSAVIGAGSASAQTTNTQTPEWTIRVLNTQEVDLAGMIGKGIAADFAQTLETNPGLRLVHVNVSRGGYLKEAWGLASLIHQAKLNTYVPKACVSACTIVAAAGIKRFLRDGAKLGYTNYEIPEKGLLTADQWPQLYKITFPADFVAKVVATAPGRPWAPTNQELLGSGAVTDLVSGEQFAASGSAERQECN